MLQRITLVVCLMVVMLPGLAPAAPVVFEVGGDNTPPSIQATVDAFRAALGNPNNRSDPGPILGGRREINWDGGGNNFTTTAPVTPFNVFLDSRGAQFTTLGTGLTQAPPSADPVQFPPGGLAGLFGNPTYATTFGTFSPERLFSPAASIITDGLFFLPGSNGTIPATVSGFGAVFTDVDLADTTEIEFFNAAGGLLFSSFVEPGTAPEGSLSFLGVVFDAGEQVARVRITTGNTALGPNDDPSSGIDVVAMDDFLYGEPQQAVPEPSTLALLGLGAVAVVGVQRCRKKQRARLG
jgi:hypothetical protein